MQEELVYKYIPKIKHYLKKATFKLEQFNYYYQRGLNIKELKVCPRCGSNKIYLIMTLSEEKEINCARCGFTGPAKELTE